MKRGKMCGCRITKTRRGTPAAKCTEATLWRFLSKKQAASLRKQHGNKAFCLPSKKSKKRGKRR